MIRLFRPATGSKLHLEYGLSAVMTAEYVRLHYPGWIPMKQTGDGIWFAVH